MATITKLDQVALGIERLIHQWQDKPIVVGLLTSYLESVQQIEDTYDQLLNERGIETAIGAQLNVIGLIVGEDRKSRLDESYRSAIKLRISINNSDGTEPVVSSLFKQLSGAEEVVFEDVFPAGVRITLTGPLTAIDDDIISELKNILAATITAELSFVVFVNPPFVFDDDDSGEGFSDVSTNSVFQLGLSTGFSVGLSSGTPLGVFTGNHQFDPETIDGGFLADNTTIII